MNSEQRFGSSQANCHHYLPYGLMQTKNLFLLTALTTGASLGSMALAPSAEAILYNVNASLANPGGTVTGTFDFNGTTYTSWNLTVSGALDSALDRTYSSATGDFTNTFTGANTLAGNGGSAPTSSILSVASPGSDFSGANSTQGFYLVLAFDPALSGSQPSSVLAGNLSSFTESYTRGIVVNSEGASAAIEENITPAGTATPVPLESDALPVVGAAAFMAGSLWFKRRRAQAKSNLEFLNNDTEK